MSEDDNTPWTYEQFVSEMLLAGWQLRSGVWKHRKTGAEFDPMRISLSREKKYGRGEHWYFFAVTHTLPTDAPF